MTRAVALVILIGCGGGESAHLGGPDGGALGVTGDASSSTDASASSLSWARRYVPHEVATPYTAVAMSGTRLVVGGDALMISDDGGVTFHVNYALSYISGLWASGNDVVALTGTDNGIAHSADGGTTWGERVGGDYGYDAAFGTSSHLIAVGARSAVLQSSDAGASWSTLPPPLSGTEHYTGVWTAGTTVIAVGSLPARSIDGGQTWTSIPDLPIYKIVAVWGSGDDVWAVGGEPWAHNWWFALIFHSADRGLTWSEQFGAAQAGPADIAPSVTLRSVWGSSADDVYAVGDNGTILHTSDRGASWQKQASGSTAHLRAIWGDSPTNVWVVGSDDVLHLE